MGGDLLPAGLGYRLDNFHVSAIIGPNEYGTPFRRAAATPRLDEHRRQYRTQQPVHRTAVDGLCLPVTGGRGEGGAVSRFVRLDSAGYVMTRLVADAMWVYLLAVLKRRWRGAGGLLESRLDACRRLSRDRTHMPKGTCYLTQL